MKNKNAYLQKTGDEWWIWEGDIPRKQLTAQSEEDAIEIATKRFGLDIVMLEPIEKKYDEREEWEVLEYKIIEEGTAQISEAHVIAKRKNLHLVRFDMAEKNCSMAEKYYLETGAYKVGLREKRYNRVLIYWMGYDGEKWDPDDKTDIILTNYFGWDMEFFYAGKFTCYIILTKNIDYKFW